MARRFGESFGLQVGAQTCGYAMFFMTEGLGIQGNKISNAVHGPSNHLET